MYIDDYLKKFNEIREICNSNDPIWNKIDDILTMSLSTYRLKAIRKINDKINKNTYYVIHLHGGYNGNGDWSDYLMQLKNTFVNLEEAFKDAWIIQIENDCLDDVHEVLFGVKML